MRRLSVLSCLALVACLQSHDDGRVAVQSDDCVTCHLVDYDGTTAPPHGSVPTATGSVQFPKTCGDCHRTTGWQPALGGLHPPPPQFPIANKSPHDSIKCLGCHDLDSIASSASGANTNCIQCHPDSNSQRAGHEGVVNSLTGDAYAYTPAIVNFCLTCHPQGLAAKHPEDKFPRTGPHSASNAPCVKCHDRSMGVPDMGGMNTTCIISGCHSLAKTDREGHNDVGRYTQVRGDGSNRHFCLDSRCHPDGRKND